MNADDTWKLHRRSLFDRFASEYARERESRYSFQSQKRIVLDFLAGAGGRILDAGCGPAMIEPALLDRGFEVHGIDVSPEMVRLGRARVAQHRLHERCTVEVGEIERLGCPDAHFDAVVAMGVLEYVADHGVVLRELHRVLKPGGTVVLTVPNRVSADRIARIACYRALGLVKRTAEHPEFTRAHGENHCLPWRLDAALERAGFHKVASRFCNFIVFPLPDLAPAVSDRLNRALSWMSATPLGICGAQYVVKAVRPA
jgi:ubiquinone/menaquinone biosynthesis C-methylase UbiE